MLGGFIQNGLNVDRDLYQAGRDLNIHKIRQLKIVLQQISTRDGAPEPVEPEILHAAERRYREIVSELFSEGARHYIPLIGETTEQAPDRSACHEPPSVRKRRRRIVPECRELVEDGREIRRVRLDNLREAVDKYGCVILLGDPGCGKTTVLEHLAYELAVEDGPLPLPLRLSGFEFGPALEEFIRDDWAGPVSAEHWNWNSPELAAGLGAYLEGLPLKVPHLKQIPHGIP